MASCPVSLDKWRVYFRTPDSDIFDIINHAIMVAAADYPRELKLKRDQIAETLFSCKKFKCRECNRIEFASGVENSDDKLESGIETGGCNDTKESKAVNGNKDDHEQIVTDVNINQVGNFSYEDVEALAHAIEEESKFLDEVSGIKEILDNSETEPDTVLYESLRKLKLMVLSMETLEATKIGKSVNALRNHRSKDIRNLVRTLVGDWKAMVHVWCQTKVAIPDAEIATESEKMSVFEEEYRLPSPPMDVFFFTSPNAMDFSEFFDGMDDFGNLQESVGFSKNQVNVTKTNSEKPNIPKQKLERCKDSSTRPKNKMPEQKRNKLKQTQQIKRNMPPSYESVPSRPKPVVQPKPPRNESVPTRPKPMVPPKISNGIKVQGKNDKGVIQKKPVKPQRDKLNFNDETSMRKKFEASKRKMKERYQEAENAKKQRTIQVMEFKDLTKQRKQNINQARNLKRNLANGQR